MADNEKGATADRQTAAERKYLPLRRAVEQAGFFTVKVVADEHGDHLVCATKYLGGSNYSGRLIFVSEVEGGWYLATPHPYHFRVVDPNRVAQAVVGFLDKHPGRMKQGAESDCDLRDRLVQISYDEYERAHGRTGPGIAPDQPSA